VKTPRTLVLGGGMVGSAIAFDMKRNGFATTLADARDEPLGKAKERFGMDTLRADLSDPAAVGKAVAGFDLVLGALPSVFGLQTLRAVIEAGKNYCDISFMDDDPLVLDALAKHKGVTAVVDCGVAPGVSHVLAGYATILLNPCERIEIYVGGLPAVRTWPYEYKAGFAPSDVVEEYTRPSRLVEDGQVVVREALSESELLEFEGVGTLEAFNTDGLRSLVTTLKVPFMKEKTMRYPGHIALMRVFRETGLFSKEEIVVRGARVRPLDVTSALLFPKWKFADGEADLTVMRVIAQGKRNGSPAKITWDVLDRMDPETGFRSMSRTTGFAATAAAALLARGDFAVPGVHPPEALGQVPGLAEKFLSEYAARGVRVTRA
jgi:lysine 6-dehydrogenase